jgi:hypothetical protein
MEYAPIEVKKEMVETYVMKFHAGEQRFIIDQEKWNFSTSGVFGDFSYRGWCAEQKRTFKEFLSNGLEPEYLLGKMSSDTAFDFEPCFRKFKEDVEEWLACGGIDEEKATELIEWFEEYFCGETEIAMVRERFWYCPHTNEYLDDDCWIYSVPESSYPGRDVFFFETIFREFQKVLAEELK